MLPWCDRIHISHHHKHSKLCGPLTCGTRDWHANVTSNSCWKDTIYLATGLCLSFFILSVILHVCLPDKTFEILKVEFEGDAQLCNTGVNAESWV